MALFSGIGKKVKSRVDALRNRANKKALVEPKAVVKKPVAPKITVHHTDLKVTSPAPASGPFNDKDSLSKAKMNATRRHRQQMKKFHKKQVKLNKQYRMKG